MRFRSNPSDTLEERLNAYLDKSGECWIWTGSKTPQGYGGTYFDGKKLKSHRAAYETWVGPIPRDMTVHHKCANTSCCNPEHLELATQRENTAEMFARKAYEARIAELEERVSALEAENAELREGREAAWQ